MHDAVGWHIYCFVVLPLSRQALIAAERIGLVDLEEAQ
jgi:hypothetical protein